MKLFLIKSLIFFVTLVFGLSYCFLTSIDSGEVTLSRDKLKKYQFEKINNSFDVDTVFLGDSSLGNAIDAKYFSEQTNLNALNVALTAGFGFAGSYNLLLKTHLKNPNLKNVIIIQHLAMMTQEISYEGYLSTLDKNKSFFESNIEISFLYNAIKPCIDLYAKGVQIKLFKYFTKYSLPTDVIINDYIKQAKKIGILKKTIGFQKESIIRNKIYFLVKIQEYAQMNNLNVIYLHGPQFVRTVDESKEYIREINDIIAKTKIPICQQLITLTHDELGDKYDHANPKIKKEITDRYINLISSNLEFFKKLKLSETRNK